MSSNASSLVRPTRRTLGRIGLATLATSLSPLVLAQPAPKKKFVVGVGSLVIDAAMAYVAMPPVLGTWKSQGYEGQTISAQNSVQAIQLLASGKLDFAQVNSGPLVQAVINNNLPLKVVTVSKVIDWSLVVPADSPIKTLADFKGKIIGVPALGAGGVPLLESYFRDNGLETGRDVTLVAVGAGPSALAALNTGRVAGLMFWASAIAGFEAAGTKLRRFFNPLWRTTPDYMLVTRADTMHNDPAFVTAVARGVAEATLYALTAPDCVRQLHWEHYPDQKPTGNDPKKLVEFDAMRMAAERESIGAMLQLSNNMIGAASVADFDRLQQLLLKSRLINKTVDSRRFLPDIPDFYKTVNQFDHSAIERAAKACKLVA